jgi:hypothetical protein
VELGDRESTEVEEDDDEDDPSSARHGTIAGECDGVVGDGEEMAGLVTELPQAISGDVGVVTAGMDGGDVAAESSSGLVGLVADVVDQVGLDRLSGDGAVGSATLTVWEQVTSCLSRCCGGKRHRNHTTTNVNRVNRVISSPGQTAPAPVPPPPAVASTTVTGSGADGVRSIAQLAHASQKTST